MGAKEVWQSEINEVLCQLYTDASTYFAGVSSKSGGMNDGFCYNPCLSFLAGTTPIGFATSITKEVASKGFLPRCLMFFQHEPGEYKPRTKFTDYQSELNDLQKFVDLVCGIKKLTPNDFILSKEEIENKGSRYVPLEIQFEANALRLMRDFEKDCFYKGTRNDESWQSPFYNRFSEIAKKLSLLHAIGCHQNEIRLQDVEWAIGTVEAQFHNASFLLADASSLTNKERLFIKIKTLIKKNGSISRSDLMRRSKLTKRDFKEIVDTLVETGEIRQVNQKTNSPNGSLSVSYQVVDTNESPRH
jgi:hypothetical protein